VPLKSYAALQKAFAADIGGAANRKAVGEVYRGCIDFLNKAKRESLRSLIPSKDYFAFRIGDKLSRAVNAKQFIADERQWKTFNAAVGKNDLSRFTPDQLTRIIYSVAISFCCYIDLTKSRDQKTPGTFFEYLISHLFAWKLGVNPTTRIQVLNLDMDTTLPTDFIFNLGKDRPKFHLPIKTRPRQRVIKVWPHSGFLEGSLGIGWFLVTRVILAKTR